MSCGLLGSREVTNETLRVTQKKKNRKDNFFLNAGGTKLKEKKKKKKKTDKILLTPCGWIF